MQQAPRSEVEESAAGTERARGAARPAAQQLVAARSSPKTTTRSTRTARTARPDRQPRPVGQAVAPIGEHHRQIAHHPARISTSTPRPLKPVRRTDSARARPTFRRPEPAPPACDTNPFRFPRSRLLRAGGRRETGDCVAEQHILGKGGLQRAIATCRLSCGCL